MLSKEIYNIYFEIISRLEEEGLGVSVNLIKDMLAERMRDEKKNEVEISNKDSNIGKSQISRD